MVITTNRGRSLVVQHGATHRFFSQPLVRKYQQSQSYTIRRYIRASCSDHVLSISSTRRLAKTFSPIFLPMSTYCNNDRISWSLCSLVEQEEERLYGPNIIVTGKQAKSFRFKFVQTLLTSVKRVTSRLKQFTTPNYATMQMKHVCRMERKKQLSQRVKKQEFFTYN